MPWEAWSPPLKTFLMRMKFNFLPERFKINIYLAMAMAHHTEESGIWDFLTF
jgi:hypothetical protein